MIKKIILVFKSHFDIGFTDLAENVIRGYSSTMLREVIETCRATENMGKLRYVWTMPAWPLRYIIDHCETELKPELERLIRNGQIVWHALPFTSHTDCCAPEEYTAALQYSRELSEQYNKPYPKSGKMTDVPGHGLMLPELLSQTGIRFLHLGCNQFATPPDVPGLFFWQSQQGGRVLTMYSKGGYGTSLLPPNNWDFPVWMALMHTFDNCGPQTADILKDMAAKAKRAYPNAEVVCGTLDDFYDELEKCDLSQIPVITNDLADTWIHGIGSYPREVSLLRSDRRYARTLHQQYLQCLLNGMPPIPEWDAMWKNYYENVALFEEHTWGADVKRWLGPNRVYEKEDFEKARHTEPYQFMERSWAEQRLRIEQADETLNKISQLLPSVPQNKNRQPAEINYFRKNGIVIAKTNRFLVRFDPQTGFIDAIEDLQLHKIILKSRNGHGIFSYQYDRAGILDIQEFLRSYGYRFTDWGILDYGRSQYPECEHLCFTPVFDGYSADPGTITFQYHTDESSREYGDCRMITLKISFPGDDSIEAELMLHDKQASPFIEAGSFIIPLAEDSHFLLGRPCAAIDPENQIQHCANHSYYCLENEVIAAGKNVSVKVFPLDTPLMSIGTSGLYEYEADFPKDRAPELWFNLYNNMWGTNFPQWIEGDFAYRILIKSAKPENETKLQPTDCNIPIEGIPKSLEIVTTSLENGILYLLLRDLSGKSDPQIINLPGKTLCMTDLWHRPVGTFQPDQLSVQVRPYGIHCIAVTGLQKGNT